MEALTGKVMTDDDGCIQSFKVYGQTDYNKGSDSIATGT